MIHRKIVAGSNFEKIVETLNITGNKLMDCKVNQDKLTRVFVL